MTIGRFGLEAFIPSAERRQVLRSRGPGSCFECGFVTSVFGEMKAHMVEAHGYVDVGGQVFKRHLCAAGGCKKPGLYKSNLGGYKFCSDHKSMATDRCVLMMLARDQKHLAIERVLDEKDKRDKNLAQLHSTTRAGGGRGRLERVR